MNEHTPVTKGDIVDQKLDKVFPEGPTEPQNEPGTELTTIARRPGFQVSAVELDAAKMLAMAGPFIPEFMRGNPGYCFGVLQLAKRWSKYDAATNSWISFDPIAIASQAYLVESDGGRKQTVGYTSQLIGAIIDAFVPFTIRLRYRYNGEGQDRTCTALAVLRGDRDPFEYTTPPLKQITPKKSPLWASDPDRQLAYYARRAWARLFAPGVLLGVYDAEELEGEARERHWGPSHARDVTPPETGKALHERLKAARAADGDNREGFHDKAADDMARADTGKPRDTSSKNEGTKTAPKGKKRTTEARKGKAKQEEPAPKAKAPAKPAPAAQAAPAPKPVAAKLPTNVKEYERHVVAWLPHLEAEEQIEAKWRSEMKLRNFCGVVEEERARIRVLVDARVQEVRQ